MSAPARFLANMILLEEETAEHSLRLAQAALNAGDTELEAFFHSLAETSRLDVREALADGAQRSLATLKTSPITECVLSLPRSVERTGFAALLDMHCAMTCILTLLRRNHAYYGGISVSASDAGVRQSAAGFANERAGHIAAIEDWIVRLTN